MKRTHRVLAIAILFIMLPFLTLTAQAAETVGTQEEQVVTTPAENTVLDGFESLYVTPAVPSFSYYTHNQSQKKIFVKWNNNSRAQYYWFAWSRPGRASSLVKGGVPNFTLTNAHPNTRYSFWIMGCYDTRDAGRICSAWSKPVYVTTPR